ncbi:MAG: SusC/RagA family TonB-linked outer membrane protein [Chitinophagaceae bacterium]|nr:SusC/RagA family TonB-linked outer membrane protein [Chitinophagaceae bacterium]
MRYILLSSFLLMCLFVNQVYAQDRVISGKVTSHEDGSGLPGVNVVLKGTTTGTITDIDGNYKLTIPKEGGVLVFSFIGLTPQETLVEEGAIEVDMDVALKADIKQLDANAVIVSAQGISREAKTLGFAQTTISSATLNNKPETDIGRALQGRTPGIQILNSSGIAGSGSRINIRGNSSITGNTQPLWIVDGVPINTSTNDSNQDFRDGQVAPTRYLDIDPNNIASMSVLRGLAATTLYGSQGRNGVILITTKTGGPSAKNAPRFEGSVSQSYYVNEAILPQFQNKWANGFDGTYGEFFSNWGSLFDGKPKPTDRHPYYEWRNVFPERPEFAQATGYIPTAAPDNVNDFFQQGYSATTSLSLSARNEFGNISLSYSHLGEEGFIKYNTLSRDNFSFGGNAKLTDKLSMGASFNFSRTEQETPPAAAGQGSNSVGGPSIWANLLYTPRNIDLTNWPWEHPITHANVYYRNNNSITNPYWIREYARQGSKTDRFISQMNVNYQIIDALKITYRLGLDTYSEKTFNYVNKGGVGYATEVLPGQYRTTTGNNTIWDHSLILSFQQKLGSNFDLSAVLGGNFRQDTYEQIGLESLGQVVFGLLEHRNFTSTLPKDWRGYNLNRLETRAWAGIYSNVSLGFKNFVYLDLSVRNDWGSTVEKDYQSLLYPGVSVSFLPTAAFPNLLPSVLDYWKLRVSYGSSANYPDPYNTRPYISLNSQRFVGADAYNYVTNKYPNRLANPNLKPELLTEFEVGTEITLLKNLLKLDFTWYNRVSKDQIILRPLDPSTGYTESYINAGNLNNSGYEISFDINPLRSLNGWDWNIKVNWTKNVSKVTDLPEGSKEIPINGYTDLGNFAIEGEQLNIIKGKYIRKSPDGQRIIGEDGNYAAASDIGIIANPNADWISAFITTLSWKGISLNMQWDYTHGGQVFSYSAATPIARGVAKDLEEFDTSLPLILPGVREVRNAEGVVTGYTPNNLPLTTAGVYFGNTIIGHGDGISDVGIYDASRIYFREISLAYSLPKNVLEKIKLKGLSIALTGNNLWFRAINAPLYSAADFNRTAFGTRNGAGFDYIGGPSARRYGFNVKLTF